MKIKEEKKMVEQTVTSYISEDGKEFDNVNDCEKHEKNFLRRELESKLNLIKQKNYTPPFADSDHNYVWFYIMSQEDVDIINEYYNSLSNYNDVEIKLSIFPCWYGIEEGYDNEAWELGTLEEYKNNVKIMIETIE